MQCEASSLVRFHLSSNENENLVDIQMHRATQRQQIQRRSLKQAM